ncbi:MAG: hypothetical protein AAFU64_21015, partial [Bacteroidota bacterium]
MIGFNILGIVIGVIFIYMLLSILASIVNEWIMMLLNARGRNLKLAIETLLTDGKEGEKRLLQDFLDHPIFKKCTAWNDKKRLPSYMSNEMFSQIMLDILTNGKNYLQEDIWVIESRIHYFFPKDSDTKDLLLSLLTSSRNNLEELEMNLQNWYAEVMERSSGWYKRKTKYFLLAIGFSISVLFNANTFTIVNRLSINPEATQNLVVQAEGFINKKASTYGLDTSFGANTNNPGDSLQSPETAEGQMTDEEAKQAMDSLYTVTEVLLKEDLYAIRTTLGMGWTPETISQMTNPWYNIFHSLLGWLVTTVA